MIEKISKICWNDFGWIKPSGTHGKSPSANAYENIQGYGHEEWLLDRSKIIDGYRYSFLQPLNLKSDRHAGKTYKIWLYTITNKQKFLVGFIDDAFCISKDESEEIFKRYKRNGWIKEMVIDLKRAGINPINLKVTPPNIFFNVKFRRKNAVIFGDFPVISNSDKNLTTTRYKLLDKNFDFELEELRLKGTDGYSRKGTNELFVDPYHNKIQNVLSKFLVSSGDYRNIRIEKDNIDVQGTRVQDDKVEYFEIKTGTPKNNIRLAVGQLFEYSMYPNKERADKLIVVGDAEPTSEDKKYIKHLRNVLSVNLFYRWIDMDKEKVSDEI